MPAERPRPHPSIDVEIAVKVPSSAPEPVRQIASVFFLYCSSSSALTSEGNEESKIKAVSSLFIGKNPPFNEGKKTNKILLSQIREFQAIFFEKKFWERGNFALKNIPVMSITYV
jgi:hypothetical protein